MRQQRTCGSASPTSGCDVRYIFDRHIKSWHLQRKARFNPPTFEAHTKSNGWCWTDWHCKRGRWSGQTFFSKGKRKKEEKRNKREEIRWIIYICLELITQENKHYFIYLSMEYSHSSVMVGNILSNTLNSSCFLSLISL